MTDTSLSDDEWLAGIGAAAHEDGDASAESDGGNAADDELDEQYEDEESDEDGEDPEDQDDSDELDHDQNDLNHPSQTGVAHQTGVPPELSLGELLPEYTRPVPEVAPVPSEANSRRRFTPWVLGAGAAAVVAVTAITAMVVGSNTAEPTPTQTAAPVTRKAPPPPPRPTPTPAIDINADGPIPFMASSDCDSAGSTPAQSLAVPDSPTAFICVLHGPGQIINLQLGPPGMPQSFVVTGVVMVPGAVGAPNRPATEPDPWLAHRVPTRAQFSFNDPANTVVSMQTHNVRGEVAQPVPRVTASHVQVIIQETSRPPVAQPAPGPEQQGGNIFGDILGTPPAGTQTSGGPGDANAGQSDASDRTFAISAIKIIGHRP